MAKKYEQFLGQRIIIPIKGVFVKTAAANESGFKNPLIIGTLLEETEEALYIGEDLNLTTIIPIENIGMIMTHETDFFGGMEEIVYPPDSEMN